MPHCCSVPNCNGNYRYGPKVAVFNFPKEPERLQKWIRAIKRDFKPTSCSKVCEKHFRPDDILWEVSATDRRTGKTLIAPLSKPRLLESAVPCIFPKYSSHLSCSQCSTKEKPDYAQIGNEAGALEKHDHNYCRMWCEGLQIYSNDDNPHKELIPKEEPTMECKEEPLSDTESHSVELNCEEMSSIPQDVSCKEENLDIKEEILPLAMVSSVIKTEPQENAEDVSVSDDTNVKTEEFVDDPTDFKENSDLKMHMIEHTNSTCKEQPESPSVPGSYRCKDCEKDFTEYCDFVDHNMQIHTKLEPEEDEDIKPCMVPVKTECEFCEETFQNEGDFEIHKVEYIDSLVCCKCKKHFLKKGFLRRHIRSCTTKSFFTCHICKKELASKQSYRNHLKIHGDRTFSCFDCRKSYTRQAVLNAHIRNVHTNDRPYSCTVCERSFTDRIFLKIHHRIHTGERPFSCPVCGKSFTQKSSIRKHMFLHTGVFQHVCEFCNKSYRKKFSLISHLRVTKHSRPYQCDICSKFFVLKKDFEAHICKEHSRRKQTRCN